jgi:hypothetical protein
MPFTRCFIAKQLTFMCIKCVNKMGHIQ